MPGLRIEAPVKALLTSVVDYAGLFPPAHLNLQTAMETYVQARLSPEQWMLDRFVLPASQLNQFAALMPAFALPQWSLSVIVSDSATLNLASVLSLQHDNLVITSLEFPPLPPAALDRLLPTLPAGIDAFFEIPWDGYLETYLTILQGTGTFAKIRTGGITATAFPSLSQLAQFMAACAHAHVPFKATAGLHHPLPGRYCLTYEPDSPTATMHGFLNVAIGAALLYWQKITPEEGLEVLQVSALNSREKSIAHSQKTSQKTNQKISQIPDVKQSNMEKMDYFWFQPEGIVWRDRFLSLPELEDARRNFFRSFGSCSIQEPIDDLKSLISNL